MKKCIVLLLVSVSLSISGQGLIDYKPRAKEILDLLLAQKFSKIHELLDSSVVGRLDSARLRKVWADLLVYGGAFEKVVEVTTDHQQNFDVVEEHCQFEKKKVKIKIVFGNNDKIKGIFMLPDDPLEHYKAPDYINADQITERNTFVACPEGPLPAILTSPITPGLHPALILVHGSGANDKDETVGPLKIFKDLAGGLATQGIAVLRYDKRTRTNARKVAQKRYSITVKEETMDDVLSALKTLKRDSTIDSTRIFFLGHSLGGYLMPRIAEQYPELKGMILLAANSRPLEDIIFSQSAYLLTIDSPTARKKDMIDSIQRQVIKVKALNESNRNDSISLLHFPPVYWLDLNSYDPFKEALASRVPMLILHGERDYQVTMEDYNGWKNALKNRSHVTFKTYPKLNHFFIEGEGKSSLSEYNKAGNLSVEVLNDIASWIKSGRVK